MQGGWKQEEVPGAADGAWPPVSVIVPIYNEVAFIRRSLGALLEQDYPGMYEVLCIDGMSDDGTRDVIMELTAREPRLRLIDNPKRVIPSALNTGFRAAKYELVARMDAHTLAPPEYLRRCVEALQTSGAECVGGRWEYRGETYSGCAIAAAMESRFGVGTGQWRGRSTAGEVDTVPYGLWKRERVLALGGFDESILINEDYELCYRLRKAGGRVVYSPAIRSLYLPRQDLRSLWKQYFRYGQWKARVLRKHPASFQARHGAAPLFVAGVVSGAPLAFVWAPARWVYLVGLAVYGLMALYFSLRQAARHGWRYLPLIPLVFLTLHLAWGTGFWAGVWRWWVRGEGSREPA